MKNGKKWSFWTKKNCFLAEFSLAEWGVYPPSPLNGKSSCPKTLSGNGGHPPPLNGKKVVFESFPYMGWSYP